MHAHSFVICVSVPSHGVPSGCPKSAGSVGKRVVPYGGGCKQGWGRRVAARVGGRAGGRGGHGGWAGGGGVQLVLLVCPPNQLLRRNLPLSDSVWGESCLRFVFVVLAPAKTKIQKIR